MAIYDRGFVTCTQNCPLTLSCGRVGAVRRSTEFHEPTDPVDFLFIADHSGAGDYRDAAHLRGFEGLLFERLMEDIAPQSSYAITYAVRGWPVEPAQIAEYGKLIPRSDTDKFESISLNKHLDKHTIIQKCLPFLRDEIARLRPKLIVVLGNTALEALFPRETRSISRMQDVTASYLGVQTRFLPHPAVMVRNPSARAGYQIQMAAVLTGKQAQKNTTPGKFTILRTVQEVIDYVEFLESSEIDVSLDTETSGVQSRYGNKLATIQLGDHDNHSAVIPFHHPESPFGPAEIEQIKPYLIRLFTQKSKIKNWITHNVKFENHILQQALGITLCSAPIFDVWVAAFLLDENRTMRAAEFKYGIYSLKQLTYDYLNFDGYDQGILKTRAEGNLFDLPLEALSEYGAIDTWATRGLKYALLEEAEKQKYTDQLLNLMYHYFNPIFALFTDIEWNGFYADVGHLRHLMSKASPMLSRIKEIEANLKQNKYAQQANQKLLAEASGGLNSRIVPFGGQYPWIFDFSKKNHPQTLFFDILRLKPSTYGKSGAGSVDVNWQEKNKHATLVPEFMDYVLMRKMFDSFVKQLYDYVNPASSHANSNTDSRIRASFFVSSVVTGRVSCKEPNIQATPRADSPAKKAIKNIFQAPPGEYMVQLDYKANEVRWVGILSQDAGLAAIFNEAKVVLDDFRLNPTPEKLRRAELLGDVHKVNAVRMFGIPIEDVTKDQRQASKAVVFGILYDSTIWSIAEQYNKTPEEVQSWFDAFYTASPAVAVWKKQMKDMAKAHGYVETPHGRRRRFPIFDLYRDHNGYFSENYVPREQNYMIQEALRQASNAPVQGSASDGGMVGAALFANYIRKHKKPWYLTNAVHDSAIFTCAPAELREALRVAETCFTTDVMDYMNLKFGINFNLPLEVEFEIGTKWGELHKWDYSEADLQEILTKLERAA